MLDGWEEGFKRTLPDVALQFGAIASHAKSRSISIWCSEGLVSIYATEIHTANVLYCP